MNHAILINYAANLKIFALAQPAMVKNSVEIYISEPEKV
jgi:hypothetical protein